ncbi:MAG: hypothetical protein EXS67_06515 [Candidatus Margulisbacteria bacterium]|nr:hypothetical protein [Candidatus Margulisiibacteriota bacterium]
MPIFIIIISGFLHAIWNVIAKKSRNKNAFLLSVQSMSILIFFPYVLSHLNAINWCWQSILVMIASMVFHGVYCVLLSRAYSVADISKIYPITRGSSSLIVPLVAVTMMGERLTFLGWSGVVAIVLGILLLNESSWSTEGIKKLITPHTLLALMIGACIASYILVDKIAVHYFPVLTVNWIGTAGNIIMLLFFVRSKRTVIREWKINYIKILIGAILAPLSYILFLYVVQNHQVAQLAPIREIGTVFGVAIGVFLLKEPKGPRRLIASALVTGGIILLGMNR